MRSPKISMLHFAFAAFLLAAPAGVQAAAQYNLTMSVSGQIPIAGVSKPIAVTVTRKNAPLPQSKAVFCSAAANFHTTVNGYQWKVSKCTYNKRIHVGRTTLQGTVRIAGIKRPLSLNVTYRYVRVAAVGGAVAGIVKGNSDLLINVNGKFNFLGLGWHKFRSSVMRRNLNKPASRASFCGAARNFAGANWRVARCSYNVKSGKGRVVHVGKFNSNGTLVPVRFTADYIYTNALAQPVLTGVAKKGKNILKWAAVRGARGYTVYRKAPGQGMRVYRKLGKVTRFVDRKIQQGKLYTYAVVATNNRTYSPKSNRVTLKAR